MTLSRYSKTLLVLSGLIASVVGAGLLIVPVAFHATSGIDLGPNISLLNEVRASGGGLLAAGILITAGAFWSRLAFTSLLLAALIYLAYGVSRIFSMVFDGVPHTNLVQVTIIEFAIGLLCMLVLLRNKQPQ